MSKKKKSAPIFLEKCFCCGRLHSEGDTCSCGTPSGWRSPTTRVLEGDDWDK